MTATIALTPTAQPGAVRLRLRHPDGLGMQSAQVNGRPAKILVQRQMIELPPNTTRWQVVARF